MVGGLAVIGLVTYFLFRVAALFITLLTQANATIAASIIASFIGLTGILATQYQARKRQVEEAHREEKIKLYSKFLDIAASHLKQGSTDLTHRLISKEELFEFFWEFKTKLILRGSPDVIQAMARFEAVSVEGGDVLSAVDDIYRAVRKDVGLSNWGLKRNELVAVYLKSADRKALLR